MRSLCQIDPLNDHRWPLLLQRHWQASVFHTPGWLEALRRTYGYEPVAFSDTDSAATLKNAVVFCRVNSRLTGCRFVSVPFSDHCQPLVSVKESYYSLLNSLKLALEHYHWKYLEIRPVLWPDFTKDREVRFVPR